MRTLTNILTLLLLSVLLVSIGCKPKSPTSQIVQRIDVDPGFSTYIDEYSNGIVPLTASFKIRLTEAVKQTIEQNQKAIDCKNLFTIKPTVKGECTYQDGIFAFQPSENLQEGTEYIITFHLKDIMNVPKAFDDFKFNVFTFKRNFAISVEGLRTNSTMPADEFSLQGEIISSVPLQPEDVEKIIKAQQEGNELEITWEHQSDQIIHLFSIKKIKRFSKTSLLQLSWNGKPVGVNEKNEIQIEVPKVDEFKLMSTLVTHQPKQQIKLFFSDAIDSQHDLEGLVEIKGVPQTEISVDGNVLTLFLKERLAGNYTLEVDQNIRNTKGNTLAIGSSEQIDFNLLKPALRLPGRGVIMPDNGSVIFPFEAVNLKAVDLRIVKIFPSNMIYFLQNSSIDDTYDMKRVGKLIYSKRIDLVSNESINLNKWNAFSIDLSKHIQVEKGAIYEVEIGMQKAYSVYTCTETPDEKTEKNYETNRAIEIEKEYWEDPEIWENEYNDRYYYNWELHDNPCSMAYYTNDRNIQRNILVSNIGLTVKKGKTNEILVACSDIQTAKPMNGVSLEVYNYQLQVIGTGGSDGLGFAVIKVSQKPFLLVAKFNNQISYLKLNDSKTLSLSQFDVSGQEIQNGIKAFVYAERGVWRPGDSIYLSVFVEDKYAPLPDQHPVLFKLMNPKGQIIQEQIQALNKQHLVCFKTATSPDAETGPWTAIISIGGAEFNKYLRIETVKPNRLKINFKTSSELIKNDDQQAMAEIESSWLTGIAAPNLRTIVELSLKTGDTKFSSFPLFVFDDETKNFNFETKTLLDANSDDNGKLRCPLLAGKISDAPGILNAEFTVRVFETGGDASIRQFNKKYSPFSKYAGLYIGRTNDKSDYIEVNDNSALKVVSTDASGKAGSDRIELMVYQTEWRWWWESSDQNIGSYVSRNNSKLVFSTKVETSNQPVELAQIFKKLQAGRYLVVAQSSSGHTAARTVYKDPGYYYGNQATNQATMLTFTSDKKEYTSGERIQISFQAPDEGKALVTIENGSRILDKFWMITKSGKNELKIKASEEMAPYAYLHISLIQPFGQQNNDHPIRMYGILPLAVENPGSRLHPVLQIPEDFRPEQTVNFSVSEKNGKAMNYTIAMVDEGLLDLTGFQTPNPWSGIYQREALGVKTWDLFDDVLGAYGGRIEKLFAVGGDMSPVDPTKNRASRFTPLVRFAGPFRIEKGQSGKHSFKVPSYTGSVRTMVIAGNDGAFGSTEKTSAVKSPLMLLAVAPRSFGFEEEMTLPVSVFAQNSTIKNVRVKIESSAHFTLQSEKEMSLSFAEIGEKGLEFKLKTNELEGTGSIVLTAVSGNETAKYELFIPVKTRELPVSTNVSKLLGPGEELSHRIIPFGIKGSNKTSVTVSGLPSINLNSRISYLIQYPHGCTEQIISSVFPQLYLPSIQELAIEQKVQTDLNVKEGILKLTKNQNTDGSFGFWPGSSGNDEWLTNYAGHFFIEAENKGFTISSQMKRNWLNYQSRMANDWKGNLPHQKMVQAYRLYTLALAGKSNFSAMNRLREDQKLSISGRWFLAAAYAEAGRPEAAYQLIDMRNTNSTDDFSQFTYGDSTRDRAMLLLCMIRLNDRNNIFELFKQIAGSLNGEEWMNTQTTSFALVAASKSIEQMKGDQKGLSFKLTINTEKTQEVKTSALFINALEMPLQKEVLLKIKNTSAGSIFMNVYTEGIPKAGQSAKVDRNLETSVRYISNKTIVDVARLKQGTDMMAIVTVRNSSTEAVSQCANTFQVPSGWEIRNTRMYAQTNSIAEDSFDYRDFRDDRVCTYFSLNAGQTKTFVLNLNASYLGKYYFPNIQSEAMYNNKYFSIVPGKWVEVVK